MPDSVQSLADHRSRDARVRPLRVLLVEDSPLLVQRIGELVGDLPNVQLAGTAASEADAIARIEAHDIDVVILDLQLHTGSGFGVLRALSRSATAPTVIVFTNFAISAYRDTALALGARDFLDKSRDYSRLPLLLQELSDAMHRWPRRSVGARQVVREVPVASPIFHPEPSMSWETRLGNWTQLRGQIRMQWGKLTDDQLDVIEGRRDLLLGKLQESYGVTAEEAERQVRAWEDQGCGDGVPLAAAHDHER